MSYKTHMHGGRESSGGIVLAKRSNEGLGGPKEIVEGRPLAEENVNPSIPAPDCRTSGPTMAGWCAQGGPCSVALIQGGNRVH
jgi:hypothetical protein